MQFETLKTERDGAVFVITFNRPDRRNALSIQCMDEIAAAARSAESDAASRAVILTGGAEYFSAGADLTEAIKVKTASDRQGRILPALPSSVRSLGDAW